MRFVYGSQDMGDITAAQKNCWLLTNGLGGYMSTTAAYGVNRCDHGLFVAAESAPNKRNMMVHRMREVLQFPGSGKKSLSGIYLSTQQFAGKGNKPAEEDGFRHLTSFLVDGIPEWNYFYQGISIRRRCVMEYGKNTAAIEYTIDHKGTEDALLCLTPCLTFLPKGRVPENRENLTTFSTVFTRQSIAGKPVNSIKAVSRDNLTMSIRTNADMTVFPEPEEQPAEELYYAFDERDGRAASGWTRACCTMKAEIPAGSSKQIAVIFQAENDFNAESTESTESIEGADPLSQAEYLFRQYETRRQALIAASGLQNPAAQQLVLASADYISQKASTGGKTLLAGYPFFGDWGRDTMISLPGCTLASGQYETARSILKTFLSYEKDGLVPNLFPDGNEDPMYNTVDASLLLINGVWLYYQAAGDSEFLAEAYPVMARIIDAYEHGTHYGIHMDKDGLIAAGEGKYQLTWMDVCVDGFLPTPRHGKPVEINAYWYNALSIMAEVSRLLQKKPDHYQKLAGKVKASFLQKFLRGGNPGNGLRDLVSGTPADEQIRCNQIWAVTMPFTMLSPEQEAGVVSEVYRYLYTPCGLRTLNPQDPDFHPLYGGSQYSRDTAYHQGTVWVFPLGAFYLAWLKVKGDTKEAAAEVRNMLSSIESALREGCIGQLPEIYDGLYPSDSRGCFAQAWSVGEMLRVYQKLEEIESN